MPKQKTFEYLLTGVWIKKKKLAYINSRILCVKKKEQCTNMRKT